MATTERPIRILSGNRRHCRCRDCRRPIVLVVTAPHGKRLAFDRDPLVLRQERNETTFVRFDLVAPTHLHRESCRRRRAASTKPEAA